MNTQTQHWHTRTPLRVQVLGLLFASVVLGMLSLLALQWGLSLIYLLPLALLILGLQVYLYQRKPVNTLACNAYSQFFLLTPHPQSVQLRHLWQSAWAVCLVVHEQNQPQRSYCLVFWRQAHSLTAWRYLHIHVLRYQLQHSNAAARETV